MSGYFAFPASAQLEADSDKLIQNLESGVRESQSSLFTQVAQRYADEIVDALILNVVRGGDASSPGTKVLEGFASLIKSTVHMLIKQVLGKMSNEELKPLSSVIRERRVKFTDADGNVREHISFPMADADFTKMQAAMTAQANGQRDNAVMTSVMLKFADLAHHYFYDDAVKRLKLGFVGRKAVDMGGAAISKGSHSAIKKLVPDMPDDEAAVFAGYIGSLLKQK